MYRAPAHVAVEDLVDVSVAPPGRLLEHRDRELRPASPHDGINEVGLPPGEFCLLSSRHPIEECEESCRFLEIRYSGKDARDRTLLLPFPLHEPQHGVCLDEVEQHLRVPTVFRRTEPDLRRERDHDVEPLLPDKLPECLADEDFRPLLPGPPGQFLVTGEDVGEHAGVLLGGVVDPAGEHPVLDLIIACSLHLRDPPDTPLRDGADPDFPVRRDGPVLDGFPETRGRSLEDLLDLLGE